jgi:phosphoserine phosphatase RsbU/P
VIFLTGKTETDDETKGFEVGDVDYIACSPRTNEVLRGEIPRVLARFAAVWQFFARVYIHKPFSPAVVKARVHTLREAREQMARQLLDINNELEMAREIQLSILPHEIPEIRGLEIAARYVPMSSVAGDFCDFIIVDENHVGILVADVSGHGLPTS